MVPMLRAEKNRNTPSWLHDYLSSRGKQTHQTIEVIIPESITLDAVMIHTTSGAVDIQDLTVAGEVRINTVSGRMIIGNGSFNSVVLNTASNQIDFNNNVARGNISVKAESGQVNIGGSTFDNLDVSTTSGQVNVVNNIFNNLDVVSVSGRGHIKLADAADHYNIRFSAKSDQMIYNGEFVDANAMRNGNAASNIFFTSITGSLEVTDAE